MKHHKSVEFLSICRMSTPWPNVRSLNWRLSGDSSIWTVRLDQLRRVTRWGAMPPPLIPKVTRHQQFSV